MNRRQREFIIQTINESLMENGIDKVMEAVNAALYEFQTYCEEVEDHEQAERAELVQNAIGEALFEEDQSATEEDTGILGEEDE